MQSGGSYYCRGLKWEQGEAEPPCPPHFNNWVICSAGVIRPLPLNNSFHKDAESSLMPLYMRNTVATLGANRNFHYVCPKAHHVPRPRVGFRDDTDAQLETGILAGDRELRLAQTTHPLEVYAELPTGLWRPRPRSAGPGGYQGLWGEPPQSPTYSAVPIQQTSWPKCGRMPHPHPD